MIQDTALDILKMGRNVFLTGAAGSGKTHVLEEYVNYLRHHNISAGITASTGVAATHINGITINSWSGIGVRATLSDGDIFDLLSRPYLRKRLTLTDVLVIDEVSMLSSHFLDMLNRLLKTARRSTLPFGGIQVVLVGDFFQLPPVTQEENIPFAYKAASWNELDLTICYLSKEYRQEDQALLHVLHELRDNTISKDSIKTLASRLYKPLLSPVPRLYTHNANVDAINTRELAALEGVPKVFTMHISGQEQLIDIMTKSCLAPRTLLLKKGAVVMFVKNNFEKGYVNGTVGHVVDFTEKGMPIVETTEGKLIEPSLAEWVIEEEGVVKASIKQLPLRLAWAITIHKSQGMTLDAAEIDLGRPFLPGMGYVALSRLKSLSGLQLKGLNKKAFDIHKDVVEFDKLLRQQSKSAEKDYEEMMWFEIDVQHNLFLRELQKDKFRKSLYTYKEPPHTH